ncbi:MAG TPA: choice-of-anchor D domain-containing protein [Thermoanaerobaculia bacterium]|nr:choice-of-anchor D domain-containing protein [Thermoanaerobaculia bacterium]
MTMLRRRLILLGTLLSLVTAAGPAGAQSDQCALGIAISPASPVTFGQPVTVTVSRNFAAMLTVTAPVSFDGQQFCTYTNPFTNPAGNTCPPAGTIFNNLSAGNHTVSWTCTVLGDPLAGPPVTGSQTFTVGPPPAPTGSLNPKYIVLSVIYAPPGQKSSVDYNTSTVIGATTAYDHSFSHTKTLSASVSFGKIGLKADGSESWSQGQDTTSSVAVKKTATSDIITPGPANSSQGINHDYDIILLWINPKVNLVVTSSTTAVWTGYDFDTNDPANEVDVVPVYVAWLKDPTKMPPGVASALARTWAATNEDGSGPGLTQADFNTILLRDPFANGSTLIDPARFELTGQSFSYTPPPNGGQPATEKFSLSYQTVSTQSQQTTDDYVETYSISGSIDILKGLFTATMTDEHEIDITNSVTQTATQTLGQKASLKLTGPTAGYTGPTDLQVYQDNIFGTFLFAFVAETAPDFALSASPSSQVAAGGGSASYTVSASPLNGFNGNVALSAAGAPSGCGAVTFSPATLIGGSGSSTMTVPACSTAGDFTITVTGLSASTTDTTTVRLVVSPAPFVLSASPASQAVIRGGSATYTISSTGAPGFSGAINLGISGLPAGAAGSFNPASISGTGTSTLTVTTSTPTPSGDFPSITVTGTSGSLPQDATAVDLVVSNPPSLTGVGCQVTVTLTPAAPVVGQPVTYVASLSGIPAGNSQSASVNLDGLPLCSISTGASCSVTANAPALGTHALQWSCSTSGPGGSGTGSGTQVMAVEQTGIAEVGSLRPKYAVLSVIYAPPGKSSTVDYGASQLLGTTTSLDSSFSQKSSVTVTAGIKAIFDVIAIGVSASESKSFTQTLDTVNSVEVDKTNTFDVIVPGPASSNDGINHDFDVILLWLNPVLNVTLTGTNSAQWSGFSFDDRDPANEVDVVPVYVSWLKNPSTMPPDVQAALARTWADPSFDGTGPGLTTADFNTILGRDPFSNPAYVPTLIPGKTTTTDNRFDLALGKTLSYAPPPKGGQPVTETSTLSYDGTQSDGQKATDEFKVAFSVQFSGDVTIPVADWLELNFSASVKASKTLDWKNVVSQSAKLDSAQTATLSLASPSSSYTGPTDVQVYKDNVYGTFMFGFSPSAPVPDFSLWSAPDSQTVPPGGSNSYTVSTLAENAFGGSVTLSASGLPAGVTATFSPNPITPAVSATMTLHASSTAVPGDYVFTVTGTSGTLTHTTAVNVVVGPASFALLGAPVSQTLNAGQSTTFVVSSQAIAGFSGNVALTASAPAGITTSFSPTSISGTSSSTLTVTVSSSVAAGTYPVTITGANGTLTESETVTVVVSAAPFFLSVSPPTRAVIGGESAVWTVSSTPLGGFNGAVALSIDVSPLGGSGTPARFGPATIAGSGTSTLTLDTLFGATPSGSYTLTITGTSGSQHATTTVQLLVSNPFTQGGTGCQVVTTFDPAQPLAGQPVTITATLSGLAPGITGNANVSLDHQMLCSSASSCSVPKAALSGGLHEIEWTCTSSGPGTGSATQFFAVGTPGTINPKYQVLSVIYAPPGQGSSVDYGTSTTLGTSTSYSDSFSNATSLGVTLKAGLKYKVPDFNDFGDLLFNFNFQASASETFTQALENDTSISISKGQSSDIVVPGPADSTVGINHDFDVILLWINPIANFVITGPSSGQWTGLAFDPADPVDEMDVVPVYVGWLKNPSSMPPGVAFALARTWADQPTDGSGTALTSSDYANILARDPFALGGAAVDPIRYGLTGETFAYAAPPNGGQPFTESLSLKYEVSTQQTQTVSDSYAVGFSIKSPDLTGTKKWLDDNKKVIGTGTLSVGSNASNTLTLKNSTKQTDTETSAQNATLTLVGPPAGYTGPTDLQVFQDNVYGTFLFAFVPTTTFQLSATDPAQPTPQGGSAGFPVSLATFAGFTGPVTFSTKGLPGTATAAFSPSSLNGAGSTTLTITTSSSIPVGTYTFSILGTVTTAGGTETHLTQATLDVVPATSFKLIASPPSEAIVVGQSGSYLVSTDAVSTFNGTVNLSASGMPAGVTVSFSPAATLTGVGAVTLQVNVASTTVPGSYALTVTGTNGSFQASSILNLLVAEAPAQTGGGCSVGFTFNPTAPVEGQALAITATVQGLTAGSTATESISLDHQMLCGGNQTSTCAVNQTLTAGLHALEWTCTNGTGSGSGSEIFTVGSPLSDGSINPKYVVLSVIYTPPGQKSSVDYGTSTVLGTSTSLSSSFSANVNVSLPLPTTVGGSKPVALPLSVDGTFNQSSQDSRSIDINKTSSFDIQVPGLQDPADGINHDYDVILLWINPVVNLTITGVSTAEIPSYSFDSNDPANEVDVVPVYVKWLKDPTTMPPGIKEALARRWAQPPTDGTGPGLTTADFNQILKRDPFTDPNYVLTVPAGSTTSADKRFDLQAGETFAYEPPPNGGQPATESFSLRYQTTSSQGQTASDSYSIGFSASDSKKIGKFLDANLSTKNSLTWGHKFSAKSTDSSTQSAKLSLTGPCFGYFGPTDVQVFQDNVYGTFMFAFVNGTTAPDFSMCVSPSSLTINTGANDKYTISTSPINGFNGNVALTVSGLPAGVTASFSPASITGGAGASVLTITVSSSAVAGTYSLVITGTGGTITHSMTVVLTVNNVTPPAPAVCFSPSSLTFGSFNVGTSSTAQAITLTNCGTASLSITSIAASGDFTQTNNCGSTLGAGTNCSVQVTFRPTATGTRTGTISLTDNAANSPQTAGLTGTGTAPAASLSPTSLTFAGQNVGSTSAAQTVTLTNGGTGLLAITGIAASGDFAQTNNCGSALAAGANCAIQVTFKPTATGSRTGTLNVTDNAAGSPQTAALSGSGVAPGPAIVRPTVATADGVAYSNPANAEDGNPATFASGVAGGSMSGEIWSGFANIPGTRSQVNLKITSAANCSPMNGLELVYSLNGGSTFNTIYLMGFFGGPNGTRPLQTDVIPLPTGQDLSKVQVLALMFGTSGSSHQVFDAWIEVAP